MGLLERLMERVLDDATATRRAESDRRRALRDDVIAELRRYATAIERMRVAYLKVRDSLASAREPAELRREITRMPSEEYRLLPYNPRDDAITRQINELGLNTEDVGRLHEIFREKVRADVFESVGLTRVAAKKEAEALDWAWTTVRPLLDDTLDFEAVVYLREFRHELRHMIDNADHMIHWYLRASTVETRPSAAEIREHAIAAIEQVLVFADAWLAHVGGVRRQMN